MNPLIVRVLPCASIMLLVFAGCAHQTKDSGSYSTVPPHAATATTRGAYVATVTSPGGGMVTMTSSGASNDLRQKVYNMLMAHPELLPYPSKVVAAISANAQSTVVLSGTVPTAETKQKLVKAVRHVEGVAQVNESELVIKIPKSSREFNAADAK